jgi:hypothetical protein
MKVSTLKSKLVRFEALDRGDCFTYHGGDALFIKTTVSVSGGKSFSVAVSLMDGSASYPDSELFVKPVFNVEVVRHES